jgi:GGDEF domain-containing protein
LQCSSPQTSRSSALFEDRLERALARRDNRVAVLLVGLDDFKLVNERLARAAGDAVLGAVADVLRACVRSSDAPARLGGDEFVVLLDAVESPSEALEAAFGDATCREDGRSWLSRGGEQRTEILATLKREDSIAIVIQPMVDLRDAAPAGHEALARFRAGNGRPPDAWFKQAHRIGLGAQLEAHALRAALTHPSSGALSHG